MKTRKLVIDHEGQLHGPFETEWEAVEWALVNCRTTPWRLRSLSVPIDLVQS